GVTTKIVDGKVIPASGTELFTPVPITGESALRDLYVVTVKAQNSSDGTVWNSDSYQFYVYKNGALDIVVGESKEKKDSILLSNRENTLVTTLPTTTDGIMELRGKLGLNAPIGINYDDYAWSALKDGIAWTSADDTKVGLNFKQGSFYEDVKRFNYESYLPATTMAISGTGETESTIITATHANTGMATTLDVKVESLENHLYLFQMTPMIKTTLTYTDGKGTKKSLDTNDKGTLALYEPNGIEGAAYFRAIDTADENALYLGTIFPGTLRSGEGNTLVRELYPINTLDLRKVARTDLFLKNPDGTPYSGQVTVRGGVYKNGGYCQGALFGINEGELKDGKLPQTVTVLSTGKLTIQMDSTQFWSAEKGETDKTELQATDKLEYIFELTGITGKRPALVYVDGVSPVSLGNRTGEGVFTLETAAKAGIFLANQRTMDKNGDRHDVRYRPAYAGPNETTPKGTDL
ncbi:MAG: cell wall anchor protein, partial [Oscillospiraceae bacterium]